MDRQYSVEETALAAVCRSEFVPRESAFMRLGSPAAQLVKRYVNCLKEGRTLAEEHMPSQPGLKRLVLHVDLNKTILMSDAVQGADMSAMVNMLLSECCWGRMELEGSSPHWEAVGRLATDRPCGDPELMTYRHFLDTFLLPYDDSGDGPEAQKHNSQVKARRQELKRAFTEDGQPGEMFCGVHRQLCRRLALPEAEATGPFMEGRAVRHIVPSFFNLLKYLQDEELDFTLVFRTFGSDLADVAEELNLFATGQHPSHPGVRMDGSDGRVDIRLLEENHSFGAFIRQGLNASGSELALGLPLDVLAQPVVRPEDLRRAVPSPDEGQEAPGPTLLSGFDDIYEGLQERVAAPGCHALALRDNYPFWKRHNERSHAGKLMLVDPADTSMLHIFLDDNIGYDTAHIVDIRDCTTGNPVSFNDAMGTNLIKVEPLNAVLDGRYFCRTIETAVRRYVDAQNGMGSPPCEACLTPLTSPPPKGAPISPFCKPVEGQPLRSSHNKSLADLMQASTMLAESTPPRSSRGGSPPSPSASAQRKAMTPSPPRSPDARQVRCNVRFGK